MGLNESYNAVSSNILIIKPLSLLIQEEKQREISSCVQFSSKIISMNAGLSGNSTNYSNKNISQLTLRTKLDYKKVMCDYCKKTKHTRDRWFKLHGFPNSLKNNRYNGKGIAAPVQGNNAEISHIPELNIA